jgi:hypothetical protein
VAEVSSSTKPADSSTATAGVSDLRELAFAAAKFGELDFFKRLRNRLQEQMENPPKRVEFLGLRGCVKMLTGRKKWCPTCTQLEVEIVDALRAWYEQNPKAAATALLVR